MNIIKNNNCKMKLILENFRCHDSKVFKFKDDMMNVITGINGSGKSTILEAILFVLYDIRKPQTIGKKKCSVIMKHKDRTITRSKSPNILHVKYKDDNKTINIEGDIGQDYINMIYGNKETFLSSSYIRQGERNYILNGNINVLSSLVQLDISDTMNKIKCNVKELKSDILRLRTKIDVLKDQIKDVDMNIDEIEYDIDDIDKRLKKLKNDIISLNKVESLRNDIISDSNIDDMKSELKDIENIINKKPYRDLVSDRVRYESLIKNIDFDIKDIDNVKSDMKSKLLILKNKKSIIQSINIDITEILDQINIIENDCDSQCELYSCPSCRTKLKFEDNKLSLPKYKNHKRLLELKRYKDELLKCDIDIDNTETLKHNDEYLKEISILSKTLMNEYNNINDIMKLNINYDEYVDERLYTKSMKRKTVIDYKLKRHKDAMREIEDIKCSDVNIDDIESEIRRLKRIRNMLNIIDSNKKIEHQIKRLQSKYDKKSTLLDTYNVLKMNVQKAQHMYIQNYVDNINSRLNDYISNVFNDISVSLTTTKKNKTNQNERMLLNMNIMKGVDEFDIDCLSHGQISKLSICLMLVMSEILNHNIIILDETLSNIDEETRDIILDMLKSTGKTVILVSHTQLSDIDNEICL